MSHLTSKCWQLFDTRSKFSSDFGFTSITFIWKDEVPGFHCVLPSVMASFPVVAVPEDGGAESISCWQGTQSGSLHHSETSKSQSPPVRLQSDDISSSGDEPTTKA